MTTDNDNADIERLAKAGFALHWLHQKSKRPIGNDWASKPVLSYSELMASAAKGNNIGVRLGKWSKIDGHFLHIIDLDVRVYSRREEALTKLAELLPEINVDYVPAVISGSGGASRHFYILTDKAFPTKKFAHSAEYSMVFDEARGKEVKKWDWELHLLGTGAQAVIPPSIHPDTGKPYQWLRQFDFNLIELGITPSIPSEALARITESRSSESKEAPTDRQQPIGLEEDEIIAILDDLPAKEWFEDRDQWMRVGMALHHETDGSDFGFETWCKYSKLSDKFDEKDQKRVWKSFKNRAQAPFRFASLIAVVKDLRIEQSFEEMPEDDDDLLEGSSHYDADLDLIDSIMNPAPDKLGKAALKVKKAEIEKELGAPVPPRFAKLNKKHAVVRVSGKTVIMDFELDGRVTYGGVGDLHNFYENVRVPKDDTTEPVSKAWMRSPHRRTYPNGIVFAPEGGPEGAYNHWQGFSVEPNPKASCRLFIKHVREVICSGNEEHFEYFMSYFAHMVQKPWEKPGVAVVVKGKKGAGKDSVIEYIGELIKLHFITIATKDQFIGKFNAHQEKCMILSVQEGFWAGNKQDEGPLKYIITSPHVMIEPKGMNAFPIRSILRIFISSNERWVVPATEGERRFFVLEVSDRHVGDHKYFEALRKEMMGDGPSGLLDYLQNYDISDFQVRAVPDTEALAEQKLEGLRNVERWWHDVLQTCDLANHFTAKNEWFHQPIEVEKAELRDAYARFMQTRRYDGGVVSAVEFSKRMKAMLPGLSESQPRRGHLRIPTFIIPDIQTCRSHFEAVIGCAVYWEEKIPSPAQKPERELDDLIGV